MPSFHEKIELRRLVEKDLDKVLEIESSSFSRPWTRQHFLDEIGSSLSTPVVAVTGEGGVAGYLCLKQIVDEAEILDVAVNPALRGRGIGRLLVEHALSESRDSGARVVCLEVAAGNGGAIALYRSQGFTEVGRRKKYYHNGDDAILMEYTFSAQSEE
ncbi:ribosomal protein S18-alanine N-acetyltransferase [Geomonas sp. Red276]